MGPDLDLQPPPAPAVLPPLRTGGQMTTQEVIRTKVVGRGVIEPIAATTFVKRSATAYPLPWIARELIQNFVDHNHAHPGTLTGVKISETALEGGKSRFTIRGNWSFSDPTSLTSPGSDKPDRNTAGGNGLGLKQVAVLLLRDREVSKFEIRGSTWDLNYLLVRSEDFPQLKNDWLVSDLLDADGLQNGRRTYNEYIIETSNPEVIAALRSMPDLGVSDDNPRLQNFDLKTENGGLIIHPLTPDGHIQAGSLFLNGQIMKCSEGDASSADYWRGPLGITVQRNNAAYGMSIDRPAMGIDDVCKLASGLFDNLPRDVLLGLLKKTEHLWSAIDPKTVERHGNTSLEYSHSCHGMIDTLIGRLLQSEGGFSYSDFQNEFKDRKYVVGEHYRTPTENQSKNAAEAGYTILPSYFMPLGIPRIGDLFPDQKKLIPQNVTSTTAQRDVASEVGMVVNYSEFSKVQNGRQLAQLLKAAFHDRIVNIDVSGKSIRIELGFDPEPAILCHPLPKGRTPMQKDLLMLRGFVARSLQLGVVKHAQAEHGRDLLTYVMARDVLMNAASLTMRLHERSSHVAAPSGTIVTLRLNEERSSDFIDECQSQPPDTNKSRRILASLTGEEKRSRSYGAPLSIITALSLAATTVSFFSSRRSSQESVIFEHGWSELVSANERALIEGDKEAERVTAQSANAIADRVIEFLPVEAPSAEQMRKVQILHRFLAITSELPLREKLFVYSGQGHKGINIGKTRIGLHQALFENGVNFNEALSVYIHEVAHSAPSAVGHENEWRHAQDAIESKVRSYLSALILKSCTDQQLNDDEKFVISIYQNKLWEEQLVSADL
jgi:Zn-dependent protease with chaperone function